MENARKTLANTVLSHQIRDFKVNITSIWSQKFCIIRWIRENIKYMDECEYIVTFFV